MQIIMDWCDMTTKTKIKAVISVGSGKGGCGKSTLSVLISLCLKELGYNIGIADVDISGPSVPMIMGIKAHLEGNPDEGIIPSKTIDGIPVLSIDLFLNDRKTAILWKGEKKSNYIRDTLNDTNWGEKPIDYLIVDLPPGNSNEPQAIISYVQEHKIKAGIIFVSTPQEVAIHDILKSVSMARKLQMPIIGIVENMSSFLCNDCKKEHFLFGKDKVEKMSKEEKIQYLGRIPLTPDISTASDISLNINTVPEEVKPYIAEITSKVLKFYTEK